MVALVLRAVLVDAVMPWCGGGCNCNGCGGGRWMMVPVVVNAVCVVGCCGAGCSVVGRFGKVGL